AEGTPDGPLDPDRRKHRQVQLIVRPEADTKGSADIGRQQVDLVLGEAEHAAHIAMAIRRALRLVVDGEAPIVFPHRRGTEAFHRIVMLDRRAIGVLDFDRRLRESLVDVATWAWIPPWESLLGRLVSLADLRVDIGDRLLRLVLDFDERCCEARDFELLRHDERNGLPCEQYLVVVKRPERRAWRSRLIGIFQGRGSHGWPIVVREHFDHAWHCKRDGPIDFLYAALGDLAVDNEAVGEIWRVELGGIFRGAGHLGRSVHPRYWLADAFRAHRSHDARLHDRLYG